ncbi:MAG: cysteine hydrolase [Clostridiaceae bacterium]|nr:cysteine hydrolase [Clostridiaceae bacterium]
MQDLLFVVDMQNDFIDGSLGTKEAKAIVARVRELIDSYPADKVYFTRDTHQENYLDTQEGRKLPILHCIEGSEGWQIEASLDKRRETAAIDKAAFGSVELARLLEELNEAEEIRSLRFVGLCTDICVISNSLIAKAVLPEAEVIVDASACAGVTPDQHRTALAAMKACQITIENG